MRYRNTELDFSSPAALLASLNAPPWHPLLAGVTHAGDTRALEALLADEKLVSQLKSPFDVERLWQVCQIPDFRGILFEVHLDLLRLIWDALSRGPISIDFCVRRCSSSGNWTVTPRCSWHALRACGRGRSPPTRQAGSCALPRCKASSLHSRIA